MRRILVTTTLAVIAATLPAGAAVAADPPPNDDFANAEPIQGYRGSTPGDNRGATGEPGEPENARGTTPINSIWYRWTAPAGGPVVIDTCGSDPYFDTTLGVYIVGHFPQVISTVATNDNDSGCVGFQSKVQFSAVAGVTYHISVDGWWHYTGSVVLRWALGPPENDDFADADVIEGADGSVRGSNEHATGEPGEPDNAGVSKPIESVWYRWTAPYSGTAMFHTCSSRFDTTLGVYTGTRVDGLTEVASNDDACWIRSSVEFSADAGTTYHISVDGWESHEGTPVLSWYLQEHDAPTSSASSPAYTAARTFAVDYTASDAGSGVFQVELWARGPTDARFSFVAIQWGETGSF
ncbi:MAG TPA: hypothetical protein VG709_01680, partial [Actinomycetota bacterium]|nr:hypothetical protein [Actinomycetota bacterium]